MKTKMKPRMKTQQMKTDETDDTQHVDNTQHSRKRGRDGAKPKIPLQQACDKVLAHNGFVPSSGYRDGYLMTLTSVFCLFFLFLTLVRFSSQKNYFPSFFKKKPSQKNFC